MEPLVAAPLKAASTYFLINRRWYTEWQQWVGHPCVQSPQLRPAPDPDVSRILTPERQRPDAVDSPANKRSRAHSWTKERPGQIDNYVLLETGPSGSLTMIKRGLSELSDYEIVPEDAWNLLFQWYGGGPPIKRRAIQTASGGVQVELHGLQLKVYRSSDQGGEPLELTEPKQTLVKEFKASVCQEMGLDPEKVRVWDYFNSKPYALLEKDLEKTLEDCKIMDDNPILLEEQNADGTWTYKENESSSASLSTGYLASSSADVPTVGKPLQRGAVGLQNLGNTCFMNSSLQCLSNIPPLRQFFLSGEYEASLNRRAYKTEGKLAISFEQLLQMMWKDDTVKVAPRNFKWQVGQFAEQFSGYGQQDSMELIEYVIDGLKEDCNRVQGTKPYVEVKEADGRSDVEVAGEALGTYKLRSDSKIDDLFVGLFKSVVRCPEPPEKCGRTSVTFDPFLSAKLPLVSQAEQRQKEITLTVVRDVGEAQGQQTVRLKVNKDQSIKGLMEAVSLQVNLKPENCVMVEVLHHKIKKFFEENECVESIRPEEHILLCEVEDAKAFHVSSEQRWGSSYSPVKNELLGTGNGNCANANCAAIVVMRQASQKVSAWCSWGSSGRELLGMPLLLSVPRNETGKWLHGQVQRRLNATLAAAGTPGAQVPTWKLFKVDKYALASEGTPTPGNEQSLDLKESKEYFAIEWEEGASLPSKLRQEELRSSIGLADTGEQELDVARLLEMFVEDEQLGPEDAWYCSKCKEHKEAWKKLEFHQTPPVLVLQLKRFQYTRWSRERLNTPVRFPLEGLDLAPFCTDTSKKGPEPVQTVYDLVALSKHIGSLGGGHYVAYCRSSLDGEWYFYDDGSVRRVMAEEVEADKVGAYVLFYLRRDLRPTEAWGPA